MLGRAAGSGKQHCAMVLPSPDVICRGWRPGAAAMMLSSSTLGFGASAPAVASASVAPRPLTRVPHWFSVTSAGHPAAYAQGPLTADLSLDSIPALRCNGRLSSTTTGAALAGVAAVVALARRRHQLRHSRASAVPMRARKGGKRQGGTGRRRGRGGPAIADPGDEVDDVVILPEDGLTVSELATKIKKPPAGIITYFFAERGMPLTITSQLDVQLCTEVAEKYGVDVIVDDDEKVSEASNRGFLAEDFADAKERPPVVTVMGHVDHGKTTLLDTIRKRSVAATEAGGITQRIGAYTVQVGTQKATFIDTPGHEAFTSMRARGAQVTDIAVLVVAADDGVMPQTREAIAHAKAAEVPMIVAINKIDVPKANPQQTRQALAEESIISEDWGGDTPFVEISAKKNINIDSLLETITLTAEVGELKARYSGPAAGVVLESTFQQATGALATLLVQRGTLNLGDAVVAGDKFGRVRSMKNEAGKDLPEVPPSVAAQVTGFQGPPEAGDQFEVYTNIGDAREAAEKRKREQRTGIAGFRGDDDEDVMRLSLILKTDAQGSIAAVKHMFNDMKDQRYVNFRWVLTAPGPITDSDVELASACPKDQKVLIVGFNTTVNQKTVNEAKMRGIEIKSFKVIYDLFESIVAYLTAEVGKEEKLIEKGTADILAVFGGRDGNVAGCSVASGMLSLGSRVQVFRRGAKVSEGTILSLREGKTEVQEVEEGMECGFCLKEWDAWEKGDEVRCFDVVMVEPELVKKKA